MMIEELKQVIAKVEHLDAKKQMHIAKIINEELNWEESFSTSDDKLESLAMEALKEYESGKTDQKDW